MNWTSGSNSVGNAKIFRSASYGLVFLMMACVVMTLASLVQNLSPDRHAGILAGILLFIVIDRLYTYRHLKSLTFLSSEWAIALGSQWIVIALVIRLLLSYAKGLESFLTDLSLFGRGYFETIFTSEFIVTLFLAFLVWVLTAQFLALLDEIGLDVEVALHEEAPQIPSEVVPAHQRLVSLIFSLGIFLVVLTVLARLNLRSTFATASGIPKVKWNGFSGVEAGALLYFILGLALLSLSRLMSLQTHWNRHRIPVSSNNLVRQWGMYSLLFLLLVALVASLLPAGDSLGFFSIVATLVGFLVGVLAFLSLLLINLLLLLFSLPFLLFGKATPFLGRVPPLTIPPLPTDSALPIDASAFLAVLKSILLWGALVVILAYAFIRFVRDHESLFAALRRSRITNWLILAWQWLYRSADKTRASLSRALSDGWQSLVSRLEAQRDLPRPGWMSLRSLDPRRQIYFFYLAMIRRGGEQGLRRKASQTPSEYARTLEKDLPSAQEEIDSITSAFVEARYSRRAVEPGEADRVKTLWGRIRRAFQNKAKRERSADQ